MSAQRMSDASGGSISGRVKGGRGMTRAQGDAVCAAHIGAVLPGPGDLDAWTVGGRRSAGVGPGVQAAPAVLQEVC